VETLLIFIPLLMLGVGFTLGVATGPALRTVVQRTPTKLDDSVLDYIQEAVQAGVERAIADPSKPLTVEPPKGNALLKSSALAFMLCTSAISLAACGGADVSAAVQQRETLAAVCDSYANQLQALTEQRKQGNLSDTRWQQIQSIRGAIDPGCKNQGAVSDAQALTETVRRAVLELAT